ncbi:flavodoxin family protein [Fructilactobacillus fructivorans]|uniref:NADPH-dependent FMN reductase n=1 Tax=Fructilactobacillus fructivorans TaxID=1614 RepID=A0AAE6NZT0_9LACO|nr:flavodoxin family protein [Fructilactobacillus fructivorans]KRK57176.1 flavoprotein [Fructilactobacillus fructivorans]KRN42764.1 flavoprotein [Fructilactobacillus fructivorans]QFX92336.1 NADPH-dependent FMN reductase [Fructilactobacillus fructivorans]RDV64888.1 flavodoxin family protein [Fructilactobacillus fructivorans]
MRYLAFLGSQSNDGLTAKYLNAVISGLPKDAEVETLFLQDYDIKPDNLKHPNPTLDMIEKKMEAADVWIIASPTYFADLSGVTKNLFDCMRHRMVKINSIGDTLPGKFKNKHYLSLTTCFLSSFQNFFTGITDQTFRTIDKIMTSAGLIKLGEVIGTHTWGSKGIPNPKKLELCKRWGQKIANKPRKDDSTLKRYIELFGMIAVMSLVTMVIEGLVFGLKFNGEFWLFYVAFVVIFYVLLAILLHFFTFLRHRRR